MQTRKNRLIIFASPSQKEREYIRQGLARFLPPKGVETLLRDHHLLIGRGRRKEVYLVSTHLWKIYQTIQTYRHPYFIGIFLGDLQANTLIPSLHVLPHLVRFATEDAVVQVTEEGEQHFLYGRHLDLNHLHRLPTTVQESSEVIVVNSEGEGLGYGILHRKGKTLLKLTNKKDLGWYLRRGK